MQALTNQSVIKVFKLWRGDITVNPVMRSMRRFGPMFLVIVMQGVLLSVPSVAPSQAVPETVLAKHVNEPIGVAASPGRLLVTHPFCGNPREVLSISGTGKVTPFATLPPRSPTEGNPGACFEDYLTIVPAPADRDPETIPGFPTPNNGFRSNDVFVTQGRKIIQIKFDASSVATFATLPSSCPNTQSGITFDNVGSFGNGLVVVCANGQVFEVNSAGAASPQGTLFPSSQGPYEGPVVSPFTANVFPGCLIVAADKADAGEGQPKGKVFASCPDAPVAVPLAEGVTIVPTTLCTFALTLGQTYFTAIFGVGGNTIDQLPQGAFSGLSGDALVPSESNSGEAPSRGITRISTGNTTSIFRPFLAQHQGASFADCHVPVLVRIETTVQGTTRTLKIFGAANFDPHFIRPDTLRFGPTGTEIPQNLQCTLPGKDDRESPEGTEHEHKGVATCTMVNTQPANTPLIQKSKFTDPFRPSPGDGDTDGGTG